MGTGSENTFHAADYALFALSLVFSAGVGVFYAIKDRKKADTDEILLGGRKISPIPVALSLLASFQSAISIIGVPAEAYFNGTMYLYFAFVGIPGILLCNYCYIPVFYNLKITSAFEYLSLRFNLALRSLTSIIYALQMLLYMAIVLYAPALALSAVTGFPLWPTVAVVGVICVFYTTLGGIKAVVWTDTFQMLVMFAGLLAVFIQGTIQTGGLVQAWDIANRRGKIVFNDFSGDPTVRHSFWSLMVGGTFTALAIYATNQAQIQRACSCSSLTHARIAYWLNVPGHMLCTLLYVLVGIVMYAYYINCDPFIFKRIDAPDQTLPIFVMDVLGKFPGLPGLFVACLFSGALSTVSSGVNAMAAAILQDIVRPYIAPKMSETAATWTARFLAIGCGAVCLALSYVASLLGNVLQTVLSLFGVIGGPILGVFTLGMFCPWANSYGAFAGLLSSMGITIWILVGSRVTTPPPVFPRFDGCDFNFSALAQPVLLNSTNMTTPLTPATSEPNLLFEFYQLSYQYYALFAVLICVILGTIVSLTAGIFIGFSTPRTVGADLLCPFYYQLFPGLFKGAKNEKYESDPHQAELDINPPTTTEKFTKF